MVAHQRIETLCERTLYAKFVLMDYWIARARTSIGVLPMPLRA
jgi:hypothetical protein